MLDYQQDFFTLFYALCAQKNPFVFFRLPQSNKVILYQQKDETHHQTKDLTEKGFVFAPFTYASQLTYIPNVIEKQYSLPQPTSTRQNLKHNNTHKTSYLNLVASAKKEIEQGKLEKVVVSRILTQSVSGSLAQSFGRLLHAYPNAMVYYWSHPATGVWMGATPETLLKIQDGCCQTMALAGTLPYTENKEPSWSVKEQWEQQVVTDYIKTQLGKLFTTTDIKPSPSYTKRAGNLVHLCSDFKFQLGDKKAIDIIRLLHPTPAVAGVPVQKSLAFIDSYETHDRAYYAGFMGPVKGDDLQLFVNLRCAKVEDLVLRLYVGGGITAQSDLESEWLESKRKAETLLGVL